MTLHDRLMQYPSADEPEFSPARVEFDGDRGVLDTGNIRGDVPADLTPVFRECLVAAGYDPAKVRIGKMLKQSHWQQRGRKRVWSDKHNAYIQHHEFETVWLHCFKFETHLAAAAADDLDELVRAARETRAPYNQGGHWAVFQAGDLQLGKRSAAGGTPAILDRYMRALDGAVREIKQLQRFGLAGIQVSMPGDCIEGTVSQNGKNLGTLTVETAPEQTRLLRRLMFHTVEALAPLTDRLYLDVVNGNHDQAQRQINTYPGDGWATETAIAVDDALKLNPAAFGHVEVRVPDKWRGCMTVPVGDSVVTIAHGHQWRRDQAMRWWSDQALNMLPAAGSHVLQCGHYHEWQVRTTADRTVVMAPTFDCGSDWYQDAYGGTSRRGGLIYLLRGGDVSRMTLV